MKGITFSEPMVRAWHEGRKTLHHILMKPQPDIIVGDQLRSDVWYAADKGDFAGDPDREIKPRYRPGETVYIKEVWAVDEEQSLTIRYKDGTLKKISCFHSPHIDWSDYRWRSPLPMPAWASRSHALIVSVRPERVQEISREDAHNEGFWPGLNGLESWNGKPYGNAQLAFQACWESLHPGSWGRNDWVWRIELEKKQGGRESVRVSSRTRHQKQE